MPRGLCPTLGTASGRTPATVRGWGDRGQEPKARTTHPPEGLRSPLAGSCLHPSSPAFLFGGCRVSPGLRVPPAHPLCRQMHYLGTGCSSGLGLLHA